MQKSKNLILHNFPEDVKGFNRNDISCIAGKLRGLEYRVRFNVKYPGSNPDLSIYSAYRIYFCFAAKE